MTGIYEKRNFAVKIKIVITAPQGAKKIEI
jgi:hypothetical protein